MAFQEVEVEESGSYRDETFTAVIDSIEFVEKEINEDLYDMISIFFEDGPTLDFFEPNDWNELKDFMGIGRIIKDLKNSGIKFMVDPEGRQIKTVPDVKGAKAEFVITKTEKTVNGVPKTYRNWNIGNIQLNGNPSSDSEPSSESDFEHDEPSMKRCEEMITASLASEPKSERDIIKDITRLIPDRDERKPINAVRKTVLANLVEDGLIELKDDKYYLV